ncbi:MAG: glycosyltransferase family 4 protein [Candidatus Vogelbacteria bacterium]|nr:glycosyltransferase family 4 protein [Candidatus Vogelbacteria bacterium]
MKIIFFTKGDRRLPSSRTRAFLISDYLKKTLGVDSDVYHIKTRAWWDISRARFLENYRNLKILWHLNKEDVVVLQRTVHQVDFMVLILLRRFLFGRGYAFDFDDAIFLEKGSSNTKTSLIIKYADVVLAGSEFLKNYALKYNLNSHVFTTVIDTENIFKPDLNKTDLVEVVIGWTGTPVHYNNMLLLVEPLKRLIADGLSIRLLLVGGGEEIPKIFRNIKDLNLTVISVPPTSGMWTEPREIVRYIQNFDIGVYPLEKTEWNKGKDVYKAKEFMACGVPIVVSDWGENPRLIKEGVNGFLADGSDEWYQKLKSLITDKKLRTQVAANGRSFMENDCSFKVFVPKLLDLLNKK